MPRDIILNTTSRTVIQDLAERLSHAVAEFEKRDRPSDGETAEDRECRLELREMCQRNISSFQVGIMTQFPQSAVDAVLMLAVAQNYLSGDVFADEVWPELGRGALQRATAFLMEHLGVADGGFADFTFGADQRDRALGRRVNVHHLIPATA